MNQSATVPMLLGRRGVVLIASYLLVSLLLILQSAYVSRSMHDLHGMTRHGHTIQALHYGEAGLDVAIEQLRFNVNYPGTDGEVPLGVGSYDIAVAPYPGDPAFRRVTVLSTADRSSPAAQHTLYSLLELRDNPFGLAVFVDGEITGSGDVFFDMYNSDVGLYEDSQGSADGTASIGTNDTSDGSIILTGNADFGEANLFSGVGSDTSTAILTGPNVEYGEEFTLQHSQDVTPITFPALPEGYEVLPVSLSGQERIVLDPSHPQVFLTSENDYAIVLASLTITGNGEFLNAEGAPPIHVYVEGDVNLTGNAVAGDSVSQAATQMIVFAQGDVRIGGNATIYGGIYAPSSSIEIFGHSELYGAVVGEEFSLTGSASVHYDAALSESPGSFGMIVRLREWHAGTSAN